MAQRSAIPNRLVALLLAFAVLPPCGLGSESDSLAIFNQRIMPIFQSENPSSCVQCHLSSVDLKNYILPSSRATFASLRDQGLVDLERPQQSKILGLIRMGQRDLDEAARLIHETARNAELEAFSQWIEACCRDPELRSLPASALAKPAVADAVIRHARKSRVVDSFVRNVWSQRMRCFPCHTPYEIDADNPIHKAAIKTRQELSKKYDDEMLQRLEIFRETPEETLEYLVESSKSVSADRLPMLDLANPVNSLFIQKPMAKLPSKNADGTFEEPAYRFPLSHMGGIKLHPHDQSYKSFVGWIQDYANVVGGRYQSIAELPADNWYPSQLVVRVKGAPDAWPVGGLVQLFVHEWDSQRKTWNSEPIAFTQGSVTPRHLVNGALFLLGSDDAERVASWRDKPQLPRGRYLVKAYYDATGKLADDATAMLSPDDFYGKAEIARARWREGFRNAEVVPGKAFASPSAGQDARE